MEITPFGSVDKFANGLAINLYLIALLRNGQTNFKVKIEIYVNKNWYPNTRTKKYLNSLSEVT